MKKKILIAIAILLILLIIVICSILTISSKKNKENQNLSDITPGIILNQKEKVKSATAYFTVQSCINKYMTYVADKDVESIMQILDAKYVKENNITETNVLDYVGSIPEGLITFEATKMYVENLDENNSKYYVSGILKTNGIEELENSIINNNFNIAVNLDYENMIYSIIPNGENVNSDYIDIPTNPEKIYAKEKYESNEFAFISVSTENLIVAYLNKYKNNISNNIEQAYNMLDNDYREKRFGSVEEFRKYVENNKKDILAINLTGYQTKTDGDITRYICIDDKGNYYIFNETAVMEFTLILDTYTLDLPEFLEKYNVATDQQKVALNIDKFIQAINAKDYKYAYNCLADSYKNNYFKTELEFENYAKENFYESNLVIYNEFDTQGDLYTYSVILTNKSTGEQKNKTFIMQLGEQTEFVMSFDK